MLYFLDTEFNGFGGEIISFALVREDGEALSLVFGCDDPEDWVKEHVMPFLHSGKVSHPDPTIPRSDAGKMIAAFLKSDPDPVVVADWPDDIRYMCELVITGPGMMVGIKSLAFRMVRVDSYPTTLKGAVQHNAYWDAMALRFELGKGGE
jgi:hypothetical protein